MVRMLYPRYGFMAQDIRPWRNMFPQFAEKLRSFGCPFDNLVALVDGHFLGTCRPGGDACKSLNLWDFQTFAGKERRTGLKYQAAVLVKGIAIVWGPWQGTEHDATMICSARLLDHLCEIADEAGSDYIAFSDSAYLMHCFLQRILKPAPEETLSRLERRYNALMARFRIVIEQVFAEASQFWAALTHSHNMRLG